MQNTKLMADGNNNNGGEPGLAASLESMDLPTTKTMTFPVIPNSADPNDVVKRAPSVWREVTVKGSHFGQEFGSYYRYDGRIAHRIDQGATIVNRRLLLQAIASAVQGHWEGDGNVVDVHQSKMYLNGRPVETRFVFEVDRAAREQRPIVVVCNTASGEKYDKDKWKELPQVQEGNRLCAIL